MTDAGAEVVFRPQAGKQEMFLSTHADVAIYGGAAGGGKTWGLLLEALRHYDVSDFGAVIFRDTYRQVMLKGGLWEESCKIYPYVSGRFYMKSMSWRFPSTARMDFAYLVHEDDKYEYDGAQYALIGWDQLEHFSESQFFYMMARNRSVCGVHPYIRATCNPDPDSFVAKLIEWWIDQNTGFPIPERAGVIRYFARINEQIVFSDKPEELKSKDPECIPKSLTFIPSNVYDNKILLHTNPEYLGNLKALSLVERKRLLEGNWKVRVSAGNLFNRDWYKIVDAPPAGGVDIRFWDFAATEKKIKSPDPDYSAGVKLRYVGGLWYVLDCIAVRLEGAALDRLFLNVASQDLNQAKQSGASYILGWEVEPGSAGKREAVRMTRMVPGADCRPRQPAGDKITRARGFASQSEAGNVALVSGKWNDEWLIHMHNQPDMKHDDIMDATSGAFNETTQTGWGYSVG